MLDNEIEPEKPSRLMWALEAMYTFVLSNPVMGSAGQSFGPVEDISAAGDQVDIIIRNHAMMAGATGFVTNIGGLITLPVAIPANSAAVTTIQFRMFQQICLVYGLDPSTPIVRMVGIASLLGSAGVELVEEALAVVGTKLAAGLLTKIPGSVILAINQAVGFRLVTKFGSTGVVNLGRWIPVAGGVLCGSVDAALTYGVGKAAKTLLLGMAPVSPSTPSEDVIVMGTDEPNDRGPTSERSM